MNIDDHAGNPMIMVFIPSIWLRMIQYLGGSDWTERLDGAKGRVLP